ncbi:MAG: V-type ATP synthase subunit E [Oscillospiraceae bacterium]|nr:V-type ATP synthase subunit E [Oscillospiraceae bacterium]MCR4759037.1 V-type ATP synthase subunit E [Oscillospiraceae bacterium]
MDANQKLMQFMEAVNHSTDSEIAEAEQEAQLEAEQILRDAEARAKADSEHTLAAAKSKITAKYQKRMSQVGYRGKTALLSRRQSLLMELFAALREKLSAFTASADYLPWLIRLLEQNKPDEHATVLLREADMPLQEQLAKAVPDTVSFRADKSILLGGLSVLSADGRRCRNHTLDEAYSEQLRNFYRNHKIDGGNE